MTESAGSAWDCGWPAPAKLNLFLHVLGQRADGYHDLQTLFQFIDFGDSLSFRPRTDGVVRRVHPVPGIAEDDDIVLRAARRLQAQAGAGTGADIVVTKRLPPGGGLGGGSSDAATTLVALNHLWYLRLGTRALAGIGLELGADVPVFVRGRAAWAEGVGERLGEVEPAEPWYLVIVPPVAVSTAAVFSLPELTRDCPPIKIRDFLAGGAVNVCEAPVRAHYPVVAEALDWLLSQGLAPRLSGTGACVFAALPDEASARRLGRQLPTDWRGIVARGCNRSPLLTRMAALTGR